MKILHTSDWHIGKKLINRDRLDEQREALDELIGICERESVELVMIAGDVFDTFLPSAEAENLFYSAIKRLAGENRAVVMISGNHDDGQRLCACAPFAEELGVYILGNRSQGVRLGGGRAVRAVSSGEGYVVFENEKGERLYINALPYPNEARFREERTEESYEEKIKRWIARGQAAYEGGMPEIFLSHLFVAGGERSEGERSIDLGGAREVKLSWLPDCDYVALGHLHRKQFFRNQRVMYSGSLLQYSFDEAGMQKYAVLLETDREKLTKIEEIPLHSGKQLYRLRAESIEEGHALLEAHSEGLVELTLRLTAPLTAEETKALSAHKCLVSLNPEINMEQSGVTTCRRGKTKEELFDDYYRSLYGVEPDADLKSLFLEIAEEVSV